MSWPVRKLLNYWTFFSMRRTSSIITQSSLLVRLRGPHHFFKKAKQFLLFRLLGVLLYCSLSSRQWAGSHCISAPFWERLCLSVCQQWPSTCCSPPYWPHPLTSWNIWIFWCSTQRPNHCCVAHSCHWWRCSTVMTCCYRKDLPYQTCEVYSSNGNVCCGYCHRHSSKAD